MKKIIFFLAGILFTLLSCGDSSSDNIDPIVPKTTKGTIAFSFTTKDLQENTNTGSKSLNDDLDPSAIVISVFSVDQNEAVFTNKTYTLTNFNGSFLTESIELEVGEYRLTGFNVVNAANEVIYSAPTEDAEFADLVQDPLPIAFTVVNDGTTLNISPEVLQVKETDTPADFGYITFGFNIVETENVYIQLRDAAGNPLSGTVTIEMFNVDYKSTKDVGPEATKIRIPKGDPSIDVNIEVNPSDPDQSDIALTSNIGDLIASTMSDPFVITLGSDTSIIYPEVSNGTMNTLESTATQESQFSVDPNLVGNLLDIATIGERSVIVTQGNGIVESRIIEIERNIPDGGFFVNYLNEASAPSKRLSFRYSLKIGNTLIVSGFAGKLYVFSDIASGDYSWVAYDYVDFSDNFTDELYVLNGDLYALHGDELYRSTDLGASFEFFASTPLLSGSLTNKPKKMTSIGTTIFGLQNGKLYSNSTPDEFLFVETFNLEDDVYDSLYLRGDFLVVTGGSKIAMSENPQGDYFNTKDYGSAIVNAYGTVDGEMRFYLPPFAYGASLDTNHPDSLSNVRDAISADLKEVVTSPDQQEVYGVSDTTIYFELR